MSAQAITAEAPGIDWKFAVDHTVEALRFDSEPSIDSAIVLLRVLQDVARFVPNTELCEHLLFLCAQRLCADVESGLRAQEPDTVADAVYCMSRFSLLGEPLSGTDAGMLARLACVNLNIGDRRAAADAVLALHLIPNVEENPAIVRFLHQSTEHLNALQDVFPDPYLQLPLSWMVQL